MNKEFEYTIVIGRFQPLHIAHQEIIRLAISLGKKTIIILGSALKAPTPHDPFSSEEREEMISSLLSKEEKENIIFLPIRDYLYNENNWTVEIQQKIYDITECSESIGLVGHKSDETSYYLDLFPTWKSINYKPNHSIHATDIRNLYFKHDNSYSQYLDKNIFGWLEDFKKSSKFSNLKDSFDDLVEYHEKWRGAPFVPTFNTVDTVVIKSGHLLVVRRQGKYGRGLIALPGGFLGQNETQLESAIRILKKETAIAIDKEELFAFVKNRKVFDHPKRSLRGRTISEAFKLNLGRGSLPKVKGESDADKAWWMPQSYFYAHPEIFFEDHWDIVFNMISKDDDNKR